jgi:hypothetical protein
VKSEIPTGATSAPNGTSFPREAWVQPGSNQIFVSLSGNDGAHAIGVLDRTQPNLGVVKFIAVPVAAGDSDGKPEAQSFYACKGKLYVTLLDYTLNGSVVTYKPGRIGIIDPQAATFEGTILLNGQNPGAIVAADPDATACETVLVADGGQLMTVPDGTAGIELVNLSSKASAGIKLGDQMLSGRPNLVSLAGKSLAFAAIYFDPQPNPMGMIFLSSAKVVAFDPKTFQLKGDVTGKAGNINFASVSPDGQSLFVGAGLFAGTMATDKLKAGLYVGPADGTMLPMTPIDLMQTPAAIAFQ